MMRGGKAENLEKLAKAGFRVPMFVVASPGLDEGQLGSVADQLDRNIDFFAVRSSASVEDSATTSFAGHFYSAVGVSGETVFREYRNVLQSYGSETGSVILQEFIPSDKAGVLFTNSGDGRIVVNTNYGLCKTVVEGAACDEYVLDEYGYILRQTTVVKDALCFIGEGFVRKSGITKPVLSVKECRKLASVARKIERFFGSPQDVEWCIWKDRIYILQARPVTRPIVIKSDPVFYDSANIAESYSGVVLPLTLSFASRIYKVVYENLLIASGVSRRRIDRNRAIFDQMVHSFYGRMYYNMNNWYLMMSFVPGYDRNKTNLEEMITSNIRSGVPRSVKPSVWLRIGYPVILIAKMIFFPVTISLFINKVKTQIQKFRGSDIHSFPYDECVAAYQALSSELLEKWHIPVENDFLVMTWLGVLKKKLDDNALRELIRFENKSSLQVQAMSDLSAAAYANPQLTEALATENVALFERELVRDKRMVNLFKNYFGIYGGRFANELKLESSDIEEDSLKLIRLLKLYKNFKPPVSELSSIISLNGFMAFSLGRFRKFASRREELRLLRSNTFAIVRKLFNRMGAILAEKGMIEKAADIYYLTTEEIMDLNTLLGKPLSALVQERKREYETFRTMDPPPYFALHGDEAPPQKETKEGTPATLSGKPCTPGMIRGKVKVFREFYFPGKTDFDILVTRHTDPGWTTLIGLSKGLIIEHGGILSHAAIVSRELGIPTVIGVENATLLLRDGQTVTLNGTTGTISIEK